MPLRGSPKLIAALAGWLFLCLSTHLHAVQVYGTSGTSSTYAAAPTGTGNDFGFVNVAQVNGASGVYLGNGWILSAYHMVTNGGGGFSLSSIVLDGTSYNVDATTAHRVTDPTTQNPADLALYKLTTIPTDPNLKTLALSATRPGTSSSLSMAGNGIDRGAALTKWSVNKTTTPWTWTVTAGYGAYSGYYYETGNPTSLRWGLGVVSGTL